MNDPRPFPPDDPDQLWEAVARSLAGEDTAAQRDALRRHLHAHPQRAALVTALGGALDRLGAPGGEPLDVEGALRRVMARREPIRRRSWSMALLPLAATLILALGVALLWRQLAARSPIQYATGIGRSESLTLADGTRVRLGPLSRLEVPQAFGRRERSVSLSGEAYFEVAHDASRPFVVRTASARVRDVGTAFTVRAGADGSRVVVSRGSVALAPLHGGSELLLRAGDRGEVSAGGRVAVQRGAATPEDLAWTQGRLVFREASMQRVAEDLGRWYGVVVVVRDSSLARRRVTATFQDESAEDALRVVGAVVSADVRRHGDTAFVLPRRAP